MRTLRTLATITLATGALATGTTGAFAADPTDTTSSATATVAATTTGAATSTDAGPASDAPGSTDAASPTASATTSTSATSSAQPTADQSAPAGTGTATTSTSSTAPTATSPAPTQTAAPRTAQGTAAVDLQFESVYWVPQPLPDGATTYQPAGYPVYIPVNFLTKQGAKYTEISAVSPSHPSSLSSCAPARGVLSDDGGEVLGDGTIVDYTGCRVTLPALARGGAHDFTLTFSGKEDGRPFSITRNLKVQATPMDLRILVDGKPVSGMVDVPRNKSVTVTYELTNHSAATVSQIIAFLDEGVPCQNLPAAAPGQTVRCSFSFPRADGIYLPIDGETDLWDYWVISPLAEGYAAPAQPVTLRLVDAPGVSGADPSAPAATGTAGGAGVAGPATDDVPLANTGLPVGEALAAGLGAIGLGGLALFVARRRR